METTEEITARNKAIDAYNSRRDRLFGKAIYFAFNVKIALKSHEKYCADERGDVTISKDSVESLNAMADDIERENEELEGEFMRIFIGSYKKEGENG